EIESTHTIDIDRFVPHSAIDQRFFDSPYYVMPSAPVGQEAFAVIREAMRGKRMVALGRLVLSKRERRDRYEEALLAHLKAKQAGDVPERRKPFAPPHRVINLMEALRRSVAEDTKGAAPRKGASATPARKRA